MKMDPQKTPSSRSRTAWKLLLLLPFIGLCFPQIYAKATPALFGFPFFYWYQFAWVILSLGHHGPRLPQAEVLT